ncbi:MULTISPECIES: ATP-binding protein [unclassified Adlercreutzia]|uniref:ATP-binding protein n=1 Tax=unclassified Adlercreutzia TaxID=2636013 RepID=UPI0013ED15E8|nr:MULTISPECIES: ATP-binding protein [unclassified Adlercreutzia]
MRIERSIYLDKLIARKHNGLVKVVTGARRCGKSYLLFELFREHLLDEGVSPDRIIKIQLDDRKNKALRDPDACDAYVRERVGAGQHYALIDEVQMMDEFEDVLNGFLHIDNLDVYVTGSNSRFLSHDVITEFRGRGDEVRIHPLGFAEYYSAVGGDWDDAWNDYLTFGGMPHVAELKADRDKAAYLEALFRETYLRDIVERNKVQHEAELGELVDVVASAVGSLTNPDKLERAFRSLKGSSISAPTIKRYLGYLEDAFLLSEAKRYDVKGKKYISTPLKYYFEDVGLRNARLSFRQQEETHIMENVLYNELVVRGFKVDVGVVGISEGGKRKRLEIDFIANEGSRRYYIQSAFALPDAGKRAQEERPLLAVKDFFKKIIVVGGSARPSRDEHGIVTMGLKQFLLDPNSLEL